MPRQNPISEGESDFFECSVNFVVITEQAGRLTPVLLAGKERRPSLWIDTNSDVTHSTVSEVFVWMTALPGLFCPRSAL